MPELIERTVDLPSNVVNSSLFSASGIQRKSNRVPRIIFAPNHQHLSPAKRVNPPEAVDQFSVRFGCAPFGHSGLR